MQPESFPENDHGQCSNDNPDSDGVNRPFAESQSVADRTTPPSPKPKAKRATNDHPAIDLQRSVTTDILKETVLRNGILHKVVADALFTDFIERVFGSSDD